MIHFDNNRLHTESKENNRKRRKEAGRVLHQNDDDDDEANYSSNTLGDDCNDSNPGNEETFDDDYATTDSG